jgi:hypothetical protein
MRTQIILVSVLTFLILNATYSQVNPTWATAYTANPPYTYHQTDMTVDASGNIYVSGSFDDTSFTDVGSILLKYNSFGSLEWARTCDSTNWISRIAIDDSNNVYQTAQCYFGVDSIIVMKYQPNGILQWKKRFGYSSFIAMPTDIITDDQNNVYITTQNTLNKLITIKYDQLGNLQWFAVDSNSTGLGTSSLAIDDGYNVYLSCRKFDTTLNASLIKYNSSGIKQWEQNYVGPYSPECSDSYGLKCNSSNSLFTYSYSAECGSGDVNTIICKYDTSGNLLWDTALVDVKPSWQYKSPIAVDDFGNVYAIGQLNSQNSVLDSFVTAKINSTGNIEWIRYHSGGSNWDKPSSITCDNQFVYVTGQGCDPAMPLFYTVKYDINGNEIWSGNYTHTMFSSNYSGSIAVDNSGDVIVSGQSTGYNSKSIVTLKYSHSIGLEELNEQNSMLTYPNPFNSSFSVETFKPIDHGTFILFDISGKVVIRVNELIGAEWIIQRNDLSAGMYFYTLTEKGKIIGKGKLIAE